MTVATIELVEMASPVGKLVIGVNDERLCVLSFADHWDRFTRAPQPRFAGSAARGSEYARDVVERLREYFDGKLNALDEIRVDPTGTNFQRQVWAELRRIKPGQTIAYGDLARAIGSPRAVRAVGAANGANPIAIVVPCHRVIGSNGKLTGYGGGLDRKDWLLNHERRFALGQS
jgi:methylated-DNA-[protein]-cysteine S-methyltransferase